MMSRWGRLFFGNFFFNKSKKKNRPFVCNANACQVGDVSFGTFLLKQKIKKNRAVLFT